MATMAQVQNILQKAKTGQHIVPFCNNTSADFEGYVVHIDSTIAKAVKIEDWYENWPDEQPQPEPTIPYGITIKYTKGVAVRQSVNGAYSLYDDDTLVETAAREDTIITH